MKSSEIRNVRLMGARVAFFKKKKSDYFAPSRPSSSVERTAVQSFSSLFAGRRQSLRPFASPTAKGGISYIPRVSPGRRFPQSPGLAARRHRRSGFWRRRVMRQRPSPLQRNASSPTRRSGLALPRLRQSRPRLRTFGASLSLSPCSIQTAG